jgi:hypothetical protein
VVPFFIAHLGETLLACVGRARATVHAALVTATAWRSGGWRSTGGIGPAP